MLITFGPNKARSTNYISNQNHLSSHFQNSKISCLKTYDPEERVCNRIIE